MIVLSPTYREARRVATDTGAPRARRQNTLIATRCARRAPSARRWDAGAIRNGGAGRGQRVPEAEGDRGRGTAGLGGETLARSETPAQIAVKELRRQKEIAAAERRGSAMGRWRDPGRR